MAQSDDWQGASEAELSSKPSRRTEGLPHVFDVHHLRHGARTQPGETPRQLLEHHAHEHRRKPLVVPTGQAGMYVLSCDARRFHWREKRIDTVHGIRGVVFGSAEPFLLVVAEDSYAAVAGHLDET